MMHAEPSPSSGASASAPARPTPLGTPARPADLVELLAESVRDHASRPLFSEKRGGAWHEMTYAAFGAMVDEIRGGLGGLGILPGDRIGIIAGNRSEWAGIAYATYGLGAILVPMYETQQPKDWVFIARDAGISVLFVATARAADEILARAAELPSLRHVVIIDGPVSAGAGPIAIKVLAGLRQAGKKSPMPAVRPGARQTACLMYTSGTTGEPKGVVLTHDNVVSNVCALRSVIPLASEHRTLSFLPWAHALGHTVELHMLIASGASTGIAESVERLVANFTEVRPTVLVAVPRVFQRIYAGVEKMMAAKPAPLRALYRAGVRNARVRAQGGKLGPLARAALALCDRLIFAKIRTRFGGRLQFAVSGGAALAREVAEFIEALGIEVFEGYGLTETSPIVSANVPGTKRLGSVGKLLPDVRVQIDKTLSADGRDGEIVVFGPNCCPGYHQRPEETRQLFDGAGGLRTGDLGYLDDDGFLYITGRIKELYKLANGKYVAPAPLEERLKLSPLFANVMIYGDNRPCNVALVVPDPATARAAVGAGAETPLAELCASPALRARVRAEIDQLSEGWKGYEKVRAFALLAEDFTLEGGMLTPSLKLKRRAVLARHGEALAALYTSAEVVDSEA